MMHARATARKLALFLFLLCGLGGVLPSGFPVAAFAGESVSAPAAWAEDGARAVLELTGTWEAAPTVLSLDAVPTGGWMPHEVPFAETKLLDSNDIGPYFPAVEKIVTPEGEPVRTDRQAAWFRRTLSVPAAMLKGRRALLHCEGIAYKSRVFINDQLAGESVLGTAPSVYDVTVLLRGGENVLRIGVAGRAGLYDREHKTFVAPIAGAMPGIWGAVRLELVPQTRIEDVFLRTSVAKKRFEADVTLVNSSGAVRTLTPQMVVEDPAGVAEISLRGAPVTLAAGRTQTVTLGADWLAKHLWSAGTPELYRARVTLLENGAVVDRLAQPFGYREFSAQGRDLLLNGQRQVLLRNSWLTWGAARSKQVLPNVLDETTQFNCIRLHLNFINQNVIRQADRSGLMVIPEFWGFYQNNDRAFPAALSAYWAGNTAEMMRRMVRKYRNHPSVILWSLTNETFWDSVTPEHMAVADKLVKAVRAQDPTRLLQGDAEITWDGRLDVVNIHYPEGDTGTVGRQFENSGWVVPNDLYWLKKEGMNHSWRADFKWDRPLVIGEYYAQDGDEPERYTPYSGDEAYDGTKWRWQGLNGRDSILPRADNGWVRMVKMSTDHYRAAGVAALNPWTGTGLQLMPRLLVTPLDYHPNAFGGEACARKFFVANDGTQAWNQTHLQAGLLIEGREVWSERMIAAQVGPGESKHITIAMTPPQVRQKTRARLVVRLCWMRGAWPYELARHEEDVWISPHARFDPLAPDDAQAIALVDTSDAATAKALAGAGLTLTPGKGDDAALGGKRLLIVGEGAAELADAAAVARFVENGGQLLVLHQTMLPQWLPDQPALDGKHAATFSWKLAQHPALAGFDDNELRFWRPDHLVTTHTLLRPVGGAGAAEAVCGGRYGMQWSPLTTLRHGRGTATFCQYLLVQRMNVEPAAEAMLVNLVRMGLAAKPEAPAPALRLIGKIADDVRAVLREANVRTVDGSEGDGPALVDAAAAPEEKLLRRLRTEVEAGRVVWLRGLNAQTLPAVAALLPWTPGFSELAPKTVGAMRRGLHPLGAGLGSSDLYWARGPNGGKATAALGGPVLVPPALDAAVLLTEPALLVAVPLGKGYLIIDQLAWDKALAAETSRALRIVAALARNAGAGFVPPVGSEQQFQFTTLDLTKYANRGFYDEVAGDGKGGWTDQGENDMRYFLINHTGMVGGMAVAGDKFPSEVKFGGVPYKMIDPKGNSGKSVLTLRGGPHDPAVAAEIKGIAVGNARASRLWFLHAGCWSSDGGYGLEVARYEVVYTDGTRVGIPVRQGMEINDWWSPQPLSGAAVAWTGRNEKTAPIGIYAMSWVNPHPQKTIASIDVIGSLAQTQLVLLAVTMGSENGGARPFAAWDCSRYENGTVAAQIGDVALTGEGALETVGGRAGLRLQNGQALNVTLNDGLLAAGKPLAVEIEVAPLSAPGGYFGGLVEAAVYQKAGLRMLMTQGGEVVIEQFCGEGPQNAHYLKSREALPNGRFSTVRYEHDGKRARLLIDGKVQEMKESPLPAPYHGGMRIGVAGGKNYYLNGVVGNIRLLTLPE